MIQINTTTEKKEDAMRIAQSLVDRSLVACVQIVGPITSVYRWKGTVETAEEWRLEAKTRRNLFETVRDAIAVVHPYEEPEIIAIPIDSESDGYRQWLLDSTKGNEG